MKMAIHNALHIYLGSRSLHSVRLTLLFLVAISYGAIGQVLPEERSVDWRLAGSRDTTTVGSQLFELADHGFIGDGSTPNDLALSSVLSSISAPGAILKFPAGEFLFNDMITLPSNIVLQGAGADQTILKLDLGGGGHCINVLGEPVISDTTSLTQTAFRDSTCLLVNNAGLFSSGDWVRTVQQDIDLVTSAWAVGTVGQIIRIDTVIANEIFLDSSLRTDHDINRLPYIQRISVAQNVGIECLKIIRMDDAFPLQSSNIIFSHAANCWVNGVESENCTFSHIEAFYSSNIHVSNSYLHHAFGYGNGGQAFGVMLHFTTGECLVENNVFEHLRHSMIVQVGANGNVFAYNYSFDPYWTTFPNDAAGDIVLHGDHPYSNLFEQNVCQNIVIDDSHGPNGPHNTFFRNRAERYGIFFSASNSPYQNLIGNEIPNLNIPYSLVNYNIQGIGHFIYGNNNKGDIDPSGTDTLQDSSYAYAVRPTFIPQAQWAAIGTPNIMGAANIPALDNLNSGNIHGSFCSGTLFIPPLNEPRANGVLVFPNPASSSVTITSENIIGSIRLMDMIGQELHEVEINNGSIELDLNDLRTGTYLIEIRIERQRRIERVKLIKL